MRAIYFLFIVFLLFNNGCQSQSSPAPAPTVAQGAPLDTPVEPTPNQQNRMIAPTDPQARAALSVEAPKPTDRDGYRSLTFSELASFPYETDMEGALLPGQEIPAEVKALDKSAVALSGYLVPIEYREDKVSGAILVRNQLLCCFGEEPKLNEWVLVSVDPPVQARLPM